MRSKFLLNHLFLVGLLLALALSTALAQEAAPANSKEMSVELVEMSLTPAAQAAMRGKANVPEGQKAEDIHIAAAPAGLISYQGRLLQGGSPVTGTVNMTFSLYTVATGGAAWWSETRDVQVNDGLFNVMLGEVTPLDNQAVYFQDQQYLGVQPTGSSELTPRHTLGTAAYAMNLMPGSTLVDTSTGGPYGYSFWVSATDHPALYAGSNTEDAINAASAGDERQGVSGNASGNGNAAHGMQATMSGASGSCSGSVTECGAALYATASGDAYSVYAYGQQRSAYIAIQGDNTYYAFWNDCRHATSPYGIWTNGASYFSDYVTFAGGKSGYVIDICRNDGTEPLEKGDVVAISGSEAAVVGNVPVAQVRKATAANATGIMGIVDCLYVPSAPLEELQAGQGSGGFDQSVTVIKPGEYLGVVTLGAYDTLKVDASAGSIGPGDLLTVSAGAGVAAKAQPLSVQGATFYAPGTLVGKALGGLDKGTGTIPVFVTLK